MGGLLKTAAAWKGSSAATPSWPGAAVVTFQPPGEAEAAAQGAAASTGIDSRQGSGFKR